MDEVGLVARSSVLCNARVVSGLHKIFSPVLLLLLPSYSPKLLAKGQGPTVVTQRVEDVDNEVV